ncbi:MAG: preprotein translocase subunit SecY [Rickettsiales bacterium]
MSKLAKTKISALGALDKADDLKNKIIFTLLALIVFRLGSYIPVPGINSVVLQELTQQNSGGILGMFNMLSGGSLGRMAVFALGITPYITASIIMQILSVIHKPLELLKKEGESGRRKVNQYTRCLTMILAIFQSYGISAGLESMHTISGDLVNDPGWFFKLTAITTLTSGTCFLMWMGEQITARGIGNGTSLIIFSGIVAGLPSSVAAMFELGRTGAMSILLVLVLVLICVGLIAVIVFVERSYRKVPVQYPRRQVGNKIYEGDTSHIPIKINTSGVIPPIFASSLLLFPLTIANFAKDKVSEGGIFEMMVLHLGHGKPLYLILYILLIVFFSFFYTAIIFNPEETAENLKKYGGFIPGKRPGNNTATYFDYLLTRLTVIGAAYLSLICILPELLVAHYSVPFYLGGTSILIVVNVVMDTINQIQTHLFAQQYQGLLKKFNKGK